MAERCGRDYGPGMSELRIKLGRVRPAVVEHLEKSVEAVPHVQSAHVDIGAACVVVEHDGAADVEEVSATLREEGFEPRLVERRE